MATTSADQRNTRRFSLKLPLTVKLEPGIPNPMDALTKDVSARGVFFYVDSDVKEGSPIEFTLTLPPEITLTESIKVRCLGRVVRVEKSISAGHLGVGCAIDQYDFLPN